jgi:eukaryotic-like serine/threonine-protein kinase
MRCEELDWEILRGGDEDTPVYLRSVDHLDRCQLCQARMLQLVEKGVDWWSEAKECWLSDELPKVSELIETHSIVIDTASNEDHEAYRNTFKAVEAMLEVPTHPELLGRIGRYDVERLVGQGGMGVVFKGYDTELHRVVAIKVLAPHLASNTAARKRFTREARAAAAVVHPHVVPIHNVEADGKLPFLVMQFVSGESLQTRIERLGPASVGETLRVAQQVASGLAAAHAQGLVHRVLD